jgi:signal transduction histidine kinase
LTKGPILQRRRVFPAARTRIMGWVLLLVMAALSIVTFATWRLLVSVIDARMDRALRVEIQEFTELTQAGVNPRTGHPFSSVEEMISDAFAYNIARRNEKFLGYVDGDFLVQSRQQPGFSEILAADREFDHLVGSVTSPTQGKYRQPQLGEVRFLAVPVTLAGDRSKGVIVAAYLGDAERADADGAARLMLGVGAVTMLLATGAAWLLAGRILRPLRDVAETARKITESDVSKRIPFRANRGDELNDLVGTINGMLGRVEHGVMAQRRFIDDAGHELRTPITIVRGHLDVLDHHDPADIEATIAVVDDELERMNRLVSDLLLLARSEQPAFLQPKLVDVEELTHNIFHKVTRLGDRRFTLRAVATEAVVLDPQRITQALVALVDNACHYSDEGGEIAIGSELVDGWLRFWVEDSGPGIAEEDRTRIFERFARGQAGGHRSDGAGLGLSIVNVIALAHAGRVELDSVVGCGSRFSVTIPVTGAQT